MNIWDTAGQEKYHSLGPIYYRGSQGAMLIYDITDTRSFERIKNWIRELQEVLKNSACLLIVGNKIDMNSTRQIEEKVARDYAESVGAFYMECSAKDNIGINELFEQVSKLMIQKAEENALNAANSRGGTLRRSNSRRTIQVVDDEVPQQKKNCCR